VWGACMLQSDVTESPWVEGNRHRWVWDDASVFWCGSRYLGGFCWNRILGTVRRVGLVGEANKESDNASKTCAVPASVSM
jgi:hypothetical protein